MGRWGHFSSDGKEYIITRPDTPRPWINYLTNGRYCAICSHTGGGYSFIGDPGYNRITREHPGDEIFEDRPGRYIYVHEVETGKIWSLNWQPVQAPLQHFEARVGQGYTQIYSATHSLESTVTYFVPLEDDLECWMVNLHNRTRRKRTFRIYTYTEFTLGDFKSDIADRSFVNLFNRTWFDNHILFATKTRWTNPNQEIRPWDKTTFITMNIPVDGYESLRENFLGMYHYLNAPRMVVEGEIPHNVHSSGDTVGVLCAEITLDAGESTEFDVLLGTVAKQEAAYDLRHKYGTRAAIETAFETIKAYWEEYRNHLVVHTPSKDFNTSINVWNKYQCWVTSHWSEMDSYYITGSGTFGFRDTAQHIFGMLPHDQKTVRTKLQDLMVHQFKSGLTVHNWDMYSKKGKVTFHSDDAQWLVTAILNYIKETGDLEYLHEHIPYYDGGRGTVFEHLTAALDYTLTNKSRRGLSLRQAADWNDALWGSTPKGDGESIMVTAQVCWNIQELLPLLEALGDHARARRYRGEYHQLVDALNALAWDGRWYIRATTDNGQEIGSHQNEEGMIYLNAQTWPVISGAADIDETASGAKRHVFDRGKKALDAMWKKLMTPYGPALFLPPYTEKNINLGIIAQFTPGTKENGTIFLHPVAWAVIAECIVGRGDKAFDIWQRSSFITRSRDSKYKSEPYVYPEFIYGPSHPKYGQGSYTWITGSAAWFYRASTDWILGVRPVLDGLLLDPCVPKDWGSWSMERDFRGSRYSIHFKNPRHLHKGVRRYIIDGKEVSGNVILPASDGKTHTVEVVLE